MSFSSKVKEELIQHISSSRHCRAAELSAMIYLSNTVSLKEHFQEENSLVYDKAKRLAQLLKIDFHQEEDLQVLKLQVGAEGYELNTMLVERGCCKQAFIRGAFLTIGSLADPEKGYHCEFVCHREEQAQLLKKLIGDFELSPKIVSRKKYWVVYLKDSSMIVDLLNIMGAHVSLMDLENVRILKDMRNSVNRRVNCETANLNKTVQAAVKQIEDINYIVQTKGIKFLPDNLRQIAELRLEEQDTPLQELGEKLDPPLGKSGVNHRLRKISEIANTLRRSNND